MSVWWVVVRAPRFQYGDRQVLSRCSLELAPGRVVALVGVSGGGKTTLTRLLTRFYDPSEGEVTLDAATLAQYNVAWLRRHVRVVDQVSEAVSGWWL
jgi:ABC-type bacteriocin/lantibiotic exporter with double-glycine peptidase domain